MKPLYLLAATLLPLAARAQTTPPSPAEGRPAARPAPPPQVLLLLRVAQDGTGNHRTIQEAVLAVRDWSQGPGANAAGRVKWAHQLTAKEAKRYTPANIFGGAASWLPAGQ